MTQIKEPVGVASFIASNQFGNASVWTKRDTRAVNAIGRGWQEYNKKAAETGLFANRGEGDALDR